MMKRLCLVICIFSLKYLGINSLFANSPCPDTFTYGDSGGIVFGDIRVSLPHNGLPKVVITKVNFTFDTQLLSSVSNSFELREIKNGRTDDARYFIVYRVLFPKESPLPLLTLLNVNGIDICYGPEDVSGPGHEITRIGLSQEHSVHRPETETITPALLSLIFSSPSKAECGVEGRKPLTAPKSSPPWLAVIHKRTTSGYGFVCLGSLISDRHVVTAGHCLRGRTALTRATDVYVKFGAFYEEDWSDRIEYRRNIYTVDIHELYDADTLKNDIAVLTLSKAIEPNEHVKPVCLWQGNPDLNEVAGRSGVVTEWDMTELLTPRVVQVPIVSTTECRASNPSFHKLTSDNTLCAGDRSGVGDGVTGNNGRRIYSGAGLYLADTKGRWHLRGVASLSLRPDGSKDSRPDLTNYLVYADAAKYTDFIETVRQA